MQTLQAITDKPSRAATPASIIPFRPSMLAAPLVLVGLGAPVVEAVVEVEDEELDEVLEGDEGVGEGPEGG